MLAGERALDAWDLGRAADIAESIMDQAAAGIIPLQSQGDTPSDDDPDFSYSITASKGQVTGLWNVSITVTKPNSSNGVQTTLTKVILDPTIIGSTQDSPVL